MDGPALQVKDLSKRYGEVAAVAGCTLNVEQAAVTGLVGPNGAGKTTLVDLISGFASPDAGTITLEGRDVTGLPAHVIAARGLVRTFQQSRGWAALTVLENLLVAAPPGSRESIWRAFAGPLRLRTAEEDDRGRARDLLNMFGLYHMRNERVNTLSGGQRRLLELARLMMAKPKVIVLDEPVASVNPVMVETIASKIAELPRIGTTVIVVEHNLAFVASTCSTVIVMASGRVVGHGPWAGLLKNPEVVDAYLGDLSGDLR